MDWKVDRPEHLLTAAMEETLERLEVEVINGWAKRENGVVQFYVMAPAPEYGREVCVGPRGVVHSDTRVDFLAKKEARERRAARKAERRHPDIGIYDRSGKLVGLRMFG